MSGWFADPAGRHELRWHDGSSFTDQVADAGVQSTDVGGDPVPGPDAPPTWGPPAFVAPSVWAAPDAAAEPAAPATFASSAGPSKAPKVVAAVVGVLVVAAIAYVVFGGGPGDGSGTFAGEVGGDVAAGLHEIHVPAGAAALVTVTPDDDFDAIVGFAVDRDTADLVADTFRRTAFEGQATATRLDGDLGLPDDRDRGVFVIDVGFAGEAERTFVAAGAALDATVVVTGFDDGDGPSTGGYEVTIQILGLGLDDATPDGDDVLGAITGNDATPQAFVDLIEGTSED